MEFLKYCKENKQHIFFNDGVFTLALDIHELYAFTTSIDDFLEENTIDLTLSGTDAFIELNDIAEWYEVNLFEFEL